MNKTLEIITALVLLAMIIASPKVAAATVVLFVVAAVYLEFARPFARCFLNKNPLPMATYRDMPRQPVLNGLIHELSELHYDLR